MVAQQIAAVEAKRQAIEAIWPDQLDARRRQLAEEVWLLCIWIWPGVLRDGAVVCLLGATITPLKSFRLAALFAGCEVEASPRVRAGQRGRAPGPGKVCRL
jgi:hypothetical protein